MDNFFLFSSDICPFCGLEQEKLRKVKNEYKECLKELNEFYDSLKNGLLLDLLDNFSPFLNVMGISVLNRIGDKRVNELPQFELGWIYVKLWKERNWIVLKWGKSIQPETREKSYDDHDYILNLCVPVPKFLLSEYENFLEDYINTNLIPLVLDHKRKRLEKKLGSDFEGVRLKDGLAPERKEYYRLYVDLDSDEFKFLSIGLMTFFLANTRHNFPITFNGWIELKKEIEIENQLNIFDEIEK